MRASDAPLDHGTGRPPILPESTFFRWVLVPLILLAAGALGGVADALVSQLLIEEYGEFAKECGRIGGGIGLGIGFSLALTGGRRLFIVLSPVVGVSSYLAVVTASSPLDGSFRIPELGKVLSDPFATRLVAVATPVLTLAHLLHATSSRIQRSAVRSIAWFGSLGAFSGSVFWWYGPPYSSHEGISVEFAVGLINGAVYGLGQLGGTCIKGLLQRRHRGSPNQHRSQKRRQ